MQKLYSKNWKNWKLRQKHRTEASDISSCQDQAQEERVEIDRPVGLDRSVLSNSSDNFENERTKVLYMKVCRDNFLL